MIYKIFATKYNNNKNTSAIVVRKNIIKKFTYRLKNVKIQLNSNLRAEIQNHTITK